MKQWMMIGIVLCAAGCLDAPAPAGAAEDDTASETGIDHARGEIRLDIGGFDVLADIQGEFVPGRPVVVFDSGAGSTHTDWQVEGVQQSIAIGTVTLSYDRAGLGGSEENGLPKTADVQARHLHLLLQAAGLPPPYLLVSHSIAGLNARVFNDLFPGDTYGVVFVDSSHENQNEGYWKAITAATLPLNEEMSYAEYEVTVGLVRDGRAADLLRSKPIAVLSATCHLACGSNVPEPTGPDWQEFQRDLAGLSDDAVHEVAPPGTGHFIMLERPQMVIDAIWDTVERGKGLQ